MDAAELRELQAPLRQRYQDDPATARTPLRATADFSADGVTATVSGWAGPVRAGLHEATGGDGSDACSGDMLLEALLACAGVTLRSVATAMKLEVRSARLTAEGVFDARGTLGVDRTVPVGVTDVVVTAEVDTDADDAQLERLATTTERYCVVGQSLAQPPAWWCDGAPGLARTMPALEPHVESDASRAARRVVDRAAWRAAIFTGMCGPRKAAHGDGGRWRRFTRSASALDVRRPATVSEATCQRNAETGVAGEAPFLAELEEEVEVHGVPQVLVEEPDASHGVDADQAARMRDQVRAPGEQPARQAAGAVREQQPAPERRCSRRLRTRARRSRSALEEVLAAFAGRRGGTGRRPRSTRSTLAVRRRDAEVDRVRDPRARGPRRPLLRAPRRVRAPRPRLRAAPRPAVADVVTPLRVDGLQGLLEQRQPVAERREDDEDVGLTHGWVRGTHVLRRRHAACIPQDLAGCETAIRSSPTSSARVRVRSSSRPSSWLCWMLMTSSTMLARKNSRFDGQLDPDHVGHPHEGDREDRRPPARRARRSPRRRRTSRAVDDVASSRTAGPAS